ncbi:YhjD/YihY/BrkB family envelope integrity protein [Phycisphaerales bacterium AB-hyl4]|uniref:YhjD/YihY/BrkB family envelope integrity protein n=1 Tax=Natronomicrosphaera hydrolytica TaxID=3242702 RepID=A0ABV4U2W2_9BACT
MKLYHDISHRVRRLLSQPAEQATRWHKAARFAWDLGRYCTRQLREDRASEIAAALTYRTIFSLVPFFVLALIVFRAFGGFEAWGEQFQSQLYDYLGIGTVAVQQIDDNNDHEPFATPLHDEAREEAIDAQTPPPDAATESQEQLVITLEQVFNDLNEQVAQVSFTGIGVVGIVLLIWAALALAVQLEDSFNQVYRATTSRAWHLRIAIYWSLITLGPVLLAMSFWLIGTVVAGVGDLLTLGDGLPVVSYFVATLLGWILGIIGQLASFLASWLLLFLLYVLMPNTTVHLRPAAIGSMIAAALWEIAKALFALYVSNAVGYAALYGTLALIPLFLFWVYLTWLIILFGLELTYTLQTLKGRRLKEVESKRTTEQELLIDPRWVIPVMTIVGDGFEQGAAVSVGDIHEKTALPPRALTRLTDQLQREGLLHQVQDASASGERQFTLARPPELIPIHRLLDLGQTMANNIKPSRRLPAHDLLARLTDAEHAAADKLTLANVLKAPHP